MDLCTLGLEGIFGRDPEKIVRIFILRMWTGYCFDAAEFAFLWIYIGLTYINDTWKYIFYGYAGFIGLMALVLTLDMTLCIIGTDIRRYRAVPFFFAYFKLTSAVNAGIVFFNFWYSSERKDAEIVVIVLLVITGIDMALDLIEMGLGFAGLSSEKLGKRQVHIDPIVEYSQHAQNTPRRKKF